MMVEKLKTAVANINAYLSECHDDDDTVTLTANVIRSVKENYEELIRYKEDEINPEKSRWISVEERLPNEKKVIDNELYFATVLVCTENADTRRKIAHYDDVLKEWFILGDPFSFKGKVTHWMPLPELPEGGAEK